MSVRCLFGSHRPSLASIAKRGFGLIALCDACGRPMLKPGDGKWKVADPLDLPVRP
jgi:hypothetical protein